ncbi:MAG: hydrogenobyrinic/cobyrinic acid a,c-diamide synthase [Lachnospiraceae bacterium]|nr:hydrogenobyrinic/cobyrinic acid a,c-diamide synthase [Lachnospiraceae bacterium]
MHLPRMMLAAPSSGSGKTMITCGILQAFCNRGLNPASFKCGPDYIDPMFHSKVIGTPSGNLDTFFTEPSVTRHLFAKKAKNAGISVLEGVMGIYDGLGGVSVKASSYDLASVTDTPVILIVNARGMSRSVIPLIQGYLHYQNQCEKEIWADRERQKTHEELSSDRETRSTYETTHGRSRIQGVILNQTTRMTCLLLKEEIEKQTGVHVYGYVPRLDDAVIESRHLGLVTPDEIADLKARLMRLAAELEQCLDLDGILELAQSAADYEEETLELPQSVQAWLPKKEPSAAAPDREPLSMRERKLPRIAVARDEAFCFYYQDNLELLKLLGAELVPFSPLHDEKLPDQTSGLLLGGGYPELYAKQLSENTAMKNAIYEAIENGLPYLAECGGFMYLHETMEDMEGKSWPMCGCIRGNSYHTSKLGRFGYITLRVGMDENNAPVLAETEKDRSMSDNTGGKTEPFASGFLRQDEFIRAHEFHYFDSTDPGTAYSAKKPTGKRTWACIHAAEHSVAGYPHLHYWSNPGFAARFVACAREYLKEEKHWEGGRVFKKGTGECNAW